MIMNLQRIHLKQAVVMMDAIAFSRGGQLPFEVLDAASMSEEEADLVQTDVNIERVIAEAMAEARKR